jgi:hypothetical protein
MLIQRSSLASDRQLFEASSPRILEELMLPPRLRYLDMMVRCGIRSFEIIEAHINQEPFELTDVEGLRRDHLNWLIRFMNNLTAIENDARPVELIHVIALLDARNDTFNKNDEDDAGAADDALMSHPTCKRSGMPLTSSIDFAMDESTATPHLPLASVHSPSANIER